jgi:CcmD family protein
MTALGIGYAGVWFALVMYVAWLRSQQRRLAARLDAIARDSNASQSPTRRRAA